MVSNNYGCEYNALKNLKISKNAAQKSLNIPKNALENLTNAFQYQNYLA